MTNDPRFDPLFFQVTFKNLFGCTLRTLAAAHLPLLAVASVAAATLWGLSALQSAGLRTSSMLRLGETGIYASLLSMTLVTLLVYYLADVACCLIAFHTLRRRPLPTLRAGGQLALRKLPMAVVLMTLSLLAVGVGLILLVVPGLIVATMLAVFFPAHLFESEGGLAPLHRSDELTQGYLPTVFALIVTVGALSWLLGLGLSLLPLGEFVGPAFSRLLGTVAVTVTYHDLRLAAQELGDVEAEPPDGRVATSTPSPAF